MAKAKKTTKQKSKETNTLAAPNSKENTVKKVLSVSVEVDKTVEAPQPKQEMKTIKLKPGQVLYVRITESGEEVEPQVVSRSTWDKYLSKNPNFKLKKKKYSLTHEEGKINIGSMEAVIQQVGAGCGCGG